MTTRTIFAALIMLLMAPKAYAFETTLAVPAEDPKGVTAYLNKGEYIAEIAGGAVTLLFPINPNYEWLIGVSAGTGVEGGQDEANIGMIYFQPDPPAYGQAEAEQQALQALADNRPGTSLKFALTKGQEVRFWVSDFDYSDNSGMVKLRVYSVSE